MPSSEARILANQRNAARSTGPKTPEGTEKSRRNALKHGLTGAGVVLPEKDAAEVARKAGAYARELNASGELGHDLARRAALNAVRMDRAADQQTAALSGRVRQAEADFVAPEGASAEEAARLRAEAGRRAMFDPSKEATLARRYEAAAERAFFRCLKELRQMERQATSPAPAPAPASQFPPFEAMMGSFSESMMSDAEFDALYARLNIPLPLDRQNPPHVPPTRNGIDLPISAGRRG